MKLWVEAMGIEFKFETCLNYECLAIKDRVFGAEEFFH
jgi:hypothetical protein